MMDEIEMIQLENMMGYFEKEPKNAAKYLEEAKNLHKDYIANGGEFVEDNYNDMKAYALDNFKRFDKIVKGEVKRLPAACKKTAEFKEAYAAYKAAMAELLDAIEAFEIEIEEDVVEETAVEETAVEETTVEEGAEEMELVEKVIEKVATTEIDSSDKIDLITSLSDACNVVAGVLEGAFEPERLIQEAHDIIWVMRNVRNSNTKEILYAIETRLCEFYYGETSGEDVYRMMTKILTVLAGPEPEGPTPDNPKPSDSDDIAEIDKALIAAYDAVVGAMNGAYTKFAVDFERRELLSKAYALHSRELRIAAKLLCKFCLEPQYGRQVRNKLIVLRHKLLFRGDTNEIEHHSLPGRRCPAGTCNKRQCGA